MTRISIFNKLRQTVDWFYSQLGLNKFEKTKGRKLAIPIKDIIALALFKQRQTIKTIKSLFEIFRPHCSYKTLVVNLIRFAQLALIILLALLKINHKKASLVKHTDSTEIPVCLPKNAKHHKTMSFFSNWARTGKGWFYGLKLHLTTDLNRRLLSIKFTSANVHDTQVFMDLNKNLDGIFVADAGYCSEKLNQDFYQEGKRILFSKPKKNMKKLITDFQYELYNTRILIEFSIRNLKMFYGLITSLPKSTNGYFANYVCTSKQHIGHFCESRCDKICYFIVLLVYVIISAQSIGESIGKL